jgi:hypothetical protein
MLKKKKNLKNLKNKRLILYSRNSERIHLFCEIKFNEFMTRVPNRLKNKYTEYLKYMLNKKSLLKKKKNNVLRKKKRLIKRKHRGSKIKNIFIQKQTKKKKVYSFFQKKKTQKYKKII